VKKTLCVIAVIAGIAAGPARADGLPVLGVETGPEGVSTAGSPYRFAALPAGPQKTLVARIDRDGGIVSSFRVVPGRLSIPAVAYDGSVGGLSADGTRLVLIVPRVTFPRSTTTFAVLDATTLKPLSKLTLQGDFSFDAMSPDARWLYLIQYTSTEDPLQYRVRALDSITGRLDPKPVVDPREPGEAMNGHPLTRAMSPDGRWAYTLYDGTEHPFIHALDTTGRSARCIDLDWLHGRKDLWQMRMLTSEDGEELRVLAAGKPVAVVNTKTFFATTGVEADDGRQPWVFLLVGVVLLAVAVLYVAASRRRASSTSFGGATSA
jgi:hypothetical protein